MRQPDLLFIWWLQVVQERSCEEAGTNAEAIEVRELFMIVVCFTATQVVVPSEQTGQLPLYDDWLVLLQQNVLAVC